MASKLLSTSTVPLWPRFLSSSRNVCRLKCSCSLNQGERRLYTTREVAEKRPSSSINAVKAAASSQMVVVTKPKVNRPLIDLITFIEKVADAMFRSLRRTAFNFRSRRFHPQLFIQTAIVNCRFFTFFAIGGSLLGSVLCFVEGCFMIAESYLQYFHALTQRSDQSHVIELLIEAIDMFMVGTAMLVFGMSLYVMFVRSNNIKTNNLPAWAKMQSVSEAKSKIGHAVMMVLQVGVLEKIKSIPLVTGLDLACFAGSVLLSSISIFVLSRLSHASTSTIAA